MNAMPGGWGLLSLMLVGACSGGGGAGAGDAGDSGPADPADSGDGVGGDGAGEGRGDVPIGDALADGMVMCPTGGGALAPADPALLIDDFSGSGPLNDRKQTRAAFAIHEQFGASVNAQFDTPPGIEPTCGAAALGAAHIAGMAADVGATFAVIFASGGAGGMASDFYDASGMKGITFRAALGDTRSAKTFLMQVSLAGSSWSYTKDFAVSGPAWKQTDILWSELDAGKPPGAPPFDASKLNQLVLFLESGAAVDIYLDDLAFLR